MARTIREACAKIKWRLRGVGRRGRPRVEHTIPDGGDNLARWAREWVGETSAKEATLRDWEQRHARNAQRARERRPHRLPEPADTADFKGKALRRHKGLRKHESSTLTQIRTGKIGLRAFLALCRVPDVNTPLCSCGGGPETPEHLVVHCPRLEQQRWNHQWRTGRPPSTRRDFAEASADPKTAGDLARWVLRTGRLSEFRLARQLAAS
jgi:hypothetical protein